MTGIPAGTVLLVAAGGVLVYAGFTSQNPLAALKNVSSGKPTPVRNQSGVVATSFTSSNSGQVTYATVGAGGGLSSLPRACSQFAADRYSQVHRWDDGYSDCSSFVGKGLKLLGVKPPSGSTTTTYLASKDWKKIPSTSVQAGDLAISLNHVVVCLGNGQAIGQQNSRVNVQTGRVEDLMIGNKPFIYLRYMPGSASGETSPPKSAVA